MDLSKGNITNEGFKTLDRTLGKFDKMPLYIDDTPAISILEFSSKAKLYKMKYGIELIVVDYLQLMTGDKKGNRDQEIGTITRGLKSVAKILDVPIIALAQLSREVERKSIKRPMLSDLRESGNIENDADLVIFIHRPEKYGELEIDGMSTKDLLINIFAKHRNGRCGDIDLWTDESFNNLREEKEIFPELKDLSIPTNTDFNINKTVESNKDDSPF
jgi:replicative DNA helicase